MRKLLIVGLLLLGAIAFSGKYEDEITERMKVAEKKFQPDLESGSITSMLNASYKLAAEWEKELNKVYDLILKKLPAKEQSKFKADQQKWLKDREAKVKKAYDGYVTKYGQKMAGELTANNRLDITKNRALELAKKYDKLNK